MENIIRRMKQRLLLLLAPPNPVPDPIDHPDLRGLSPHELDDLPLPRFRRDPARSHATAELPSCAGMR